MERVTDHVRCEEHGWVAAVCPRCPLPPDSEPVVGSKEAPADRLARLTQEVEELGSRVAGLERRLDGDGK